MTDNADLKEKDLNEAKSNVIDESPINEELLNSPKAEELKDMISAGVWYGRKHSKTNPKMKPFIFTNRNNIEIIDLEKTVTALEASSVILKSHMDSGGTVLFVGTQPAAKQEIESLAKKLNQPYVVNRWLGGMLTNFETLNKRVEYFKKLKKDRDSGELEKYTKKERAGFNREISRLDTFFSGTENMTKIPNLMLIINPILHATALREAIRMKIPVIALASTDANPDLITYLIPGNDNAPKSITWILNNLEKALSK